jgi:hypothetical protein
MANGMFLRFYELLEGDLLRVMEEVKRIRKVLGDYKATFLTFIPKRNNLGSFNEFRPISFCNCIYTRY